MKKIFFFLFLALIACGLIALVLSAYMAAVHMRSYNYYLDTGLDPRITQRELSRSIMLIFTAIFSFVSTLIGFFGALCIKFPDITKKVMERKEARIHAAQARATERKASRIAALEKELEDLKKDGE